MDLAQARQWCADELTAALVPFAARLEALEREMRVKYGCDEWADEVAALRREVAP